MCDTLDAWSHSSLPASLSVPLFCCFSSTAVTDAAVHILQVLGSSVRFRTQNSELRMFYCRRPLDPLQMV